MRELLKQRVNIVAGHYGTGETNFSVSLALAGVGIYPRTVLIDLDIVNPYFRASDSRRELEAAGIQVISPNFANSNLDTPSLPPDIQGALTDPEALVIADVGGDDDGAMVLGRYQKMIEEAGYTLFYVVNRCRPDIADPQDAAAMLEEIQRVARLKASYLVNNTNLGAETNEQLIRSSFPYAREVVRLCGLSGCIHTATAPFAPSLSGEVENLFPIELHTKKYFE